MLSPSFIFVIAKEIESSGRHVPSFPGGQECAEDGAIFSYILYGKRCHKMMSHFLFHGPVKSQPCLAEGPFGLLLPSLYGCFPSLPGPFLFPAHITTGPRSALPGTGLRLLLAPIRRHSTWQEVALLWASSTSGPAQAEQGHPTHGVSLPVCLCCMGTSPSTLRLTLPCHLGGRREMGGFAEKPSPSSGAAPAWLPQVASCL